MTTFSSYGEVSGFRQADVIGSPDDRKHYSPSELRKLVSQLNNEIRLLE